MADKPGWMLTIRQSAPEAFRLLRELGPTWELSGATAIDAGFLEARGIRGLIWDVDGTLTAYHSPEVRPDVAAHLEGLGRIPWLRQVILSNCGEERFRELGRMFPEIEILKVYDRADGGDRRAYRSLLGESERWEGGEPGAADLRPIRKPNADLVAFAVRRLGVEPGHAAMVGDQYWTDVAGANLAGVRSIRVPTLEPTSFPVAIRAFQKLEALLHRFLPA